MKARQLTASAMKFVLVAVVLAFLGLHSLNFFGYVFPAEQSYLAWLGFGLTGGAAIGYLIMFLWDAGTVLKSWTSILMTVVCSIGEVLSALFGMRIESWKKAGFSLTEQDFDRMLLIVGILAIIHFFALIAYFAGEKVGALFTDKDGDGIPDAVDPVDNRRQTKQPHSLPKSTGQSGSKQPQATSYTLPAFLSASGINSEHAFGAFLNETDGPGVGWKVLRDGTSADGYKLPQGITHKNFDELAGKVHANGNVPQTANPTRRQ